MALFSECMPSCAQIVLDTADIVREGDFSPNYRLGDLRVAIHKLVCRLQAALHCFVSLTRANGLASPLTTLSSRLSQVLVLGS